MINFVTTNLEMLAFIYSYHILNYVQASHIYLECGLGWDHSKTQIVGTNPNHDMYVSSCVCVVLRGKMSSVGPISHPRISIK
jgi:hypothetical protein